MRIFLLSIITFIQKYRTLLFSICCILFLSLIALQSLFTPGLFTSHDGEAHITRLLQFHQALNDGQFPPRWAAGFFGGIGSPVLMLNYHLPYFVADMFVRVGLTFFDAFKTTLALSFVLSGITAFLAFRALFGNWAGLVGSLLYLWAPYRFVDIYVRAAFGESFSFIFPPIILLGIARASFPLTVLGFSGLFLSHPVASALFTPFFLGYIFVRYIIVQPNKKTLQKLILAFLISLMISSFNLIPTLTLTKQTHYTPTNTRPLEHFPAFQQLVFNRWGFDGSTPNNTQDKLSFHVGYAQILVIIIAFTYLVLKLIRGSTQKNLSYPTYLVLALSIACFFMLESSSPIWKIIHLDSLFDFPWRILLFVVFSCAFLGAWLISTTPKPLSIGIGLFLLAFAVRSNLSHASIRAVWPWGVEHYMANNYGTGDAYGEYASLSRTTQQQFYVDDRISILRGTAHYEFEQNVSHRITARIQANTQTLVRMNVMHFPGWEYTLDGQHVEIGKQCTLSTYSKQESQNNRNVDASGLLECLLEPGTHTLTAQFYAPTMQTIGNLISLAGLGAFLWNIYPSFSQHLMKRQTLSRLRKK